MTININGTKPGLVAPENDYGSIAPHDQPAKMNTNASEFKAKLIAAYARLKGITADIYIDRGIGIDSIICATPALVYGIVRVTA